VRGFDAELIVNRRSAWYSANEGDRYWKRHVSRNVNTYILSSYFDELHGVSTDGEPAIVEERTERFFVLFLIFYVKQEAESSFRNVVIL
jgi:hypothetical protein